MDFKTGDTLCNCVLQTKCGAGAYGEVWLAADPVGGSVAIKILSRRGGYSERELAGLRNYKDCNHPNLLKIRHIELRDKTIIYTMDAADNLNKDGDYLPDTLANRLRKYGRLEGKEITAMLDGLLSGLAELHGKGLVHRDIKPDNILWVNGRPTLADVGLVAAEGQGSLVGTLGFLSPELLNGKEHAEASDDFYALGKVIYCALTGNSVNEYPSLPIDKTISVDKVLGKAYRKACDTKVNSSTEFRELLASGTAPASVAEGIPKHPSLLKETAVILCMIFLVAAGVILYKKGRSHNSPESDPIAHKVEQITAEAQKLPEKVPAITTTPTPRPAGQADQSIAEVPKTETTAVRSISETPEIQPDSEVVGMLKKLGFWDNEYLTPLLTYRPLTGSDIYNRIMLSTDTPRLSLAGAPSVRSSKQPSATERKVAGFYTAYTNIDEQALDKRQAYWRQQKGTPLEIQRSMLATDKLMQSVALDAIIRTGTNAILQADAMTEIEEHDLKLLLSLRESLLKQ